MHVGRITVGRSEVNLLGTGTRARGIGRNVEFSRVDIRARYNDEMFRTHTAVYRAAGADPSKYRCPILIPILLYLSLSLSVCPVRCT